MRMEDSMAIIGVKPKESKYYHKYASSESEIVLKKRYGYRFLKRVFDITSSTCAIVALSWLLLIVTVIIKMTSDGPAFYFDRRVGKNGKEIKIIKFRTMYIDAEENIRKYLSDEQYQIWLVERKVDNDPRITKIGKFLRKTSIDELPQLFNILKGDLSVVGPRPVAKFEIEQNYNPRETTKLLSCKPGLTGNWAASGRSNLTYDDGERQRLELEYVDKSSMVLDFKLIFTTVGSVLKGNGAQ